MDTAVSYEDARRQRLEENKKRMQELGLAELSKSLTNDAASSASAKNSSKPRHIKPRTLKETLYVELRRSPRVANGPVRDYREVDVNIFSGRRSYSSRASLLNRRYASDEARLDAVLRAETMMKELPENNPSFVKPMLQSHVTGGFWLGLPSSFCKTYLPKKDDRVMLENEKGEEWETVYLAAKTGLSGGWRGFSLDHELMDGDALVFELVDPCRFKVHIARASEDNVKPQQKPAAVSSGREGRKLQKSSPRPDSEGACENSDPRKGSREKRKAKDDDFGDILDRKECLTSFLQAKKPYSLRFTKKAMTDCGSGIEVH